MERTRRSRRHIAVLPIVAMLLAASGLLATGCSLLPVEEEILPPPLIEPEKIEYKTAPAALGTLVSELRLTGTLYPETQHTLSFESQGGRLKKTHVRIGQTVKVGDLIAEMDSGFLDSQIRIQELEVRKGELILQQQKESGSDTLTIRLSEIGLSQQKIRLEDLRTQKAATVIRSPMDGQVTYLISLTVGEYVSAYQMVARIADIGELVLVTTQNEASKLPLGAVVELEYKKALLPGEVVANPSTLFDSPDERLRSAAILRFTGGLPAEAKMGESVRIRYVQDQRENVIILPRTVIHLMSGRRFVNVLADGVRIEKDVELGLTTDTEAEIVKGIDAGDQIIIG